jgi:probable rRNA maturation factor
MITIETIENLSPAIPVEMVEKSALAALTHQSVSVDAELTIVLSDDAQLQGLNLQWIGIDAPTDVLSFPSDETDPETGSRYLGDILISIEYAARQAASAGHPVEAEVQLLTVHGVLHLLGYDHAEVREKERMWAAQAEILERLGLGHIQVRDE